MKDFANNPTAIAKNLEIENVIPYTKELLARLKKCWLYPLMRGKTSSYQKGCHEYDTKLYLMMRL